MDGLKLQLVRELSGTKCRCGRTKKANQTFCCKCYYALPEAMRMALYRRLGSGYEEAYGEAVREMRGDDPHADKSKLLTHRTENNPTCQN